MPPNIVGSLLAAQQQQQQQLPQVMGALTETLQGMNQRSMMKDLQPRITGQGEDWQQGLNQQAIMEAATRWNQDPLATAESLDPVIKRQLKERLSVAGPKFLNLIQVQGIEPLQALGVVDREFNLGEDGIVAMLGLMKTYSETMQAGTGAQESAYGFNRRRQQDTATDRVVPQVFGPGFAGVPPEQANTMFPHTEQGIQQGIRKDWLTPTGTMKEAATEGRGVLDYKTATNAPGTNVTVNTGSMKEQYGPLQAGWMRERLDDGSFVERPIPGSAAERRVQEEERKRAAGDHVKSTAAQTVWEDSQRAIDVLDSFLGQYAAGIPGALTNKLPYTPAQRVEKHYASIRGNIGIDKLLDIKASGAGLGHIPQAQLEMLASLLGRLDTNMILEDQIYNIKRIQEIYGDIVEQTGGDPLEIYQKRQERFTRSNGGGGGAGSAVSQEALDLIQKHSGGQ